MNKWGLLKNQNAVFVDMAQSLNFKTEIGISSIFKNKITILLLVLVHT